MIQFYNVNSHSYLSEVDRKNLVGKTKYYSPQRYNKRLGYHPIARSSYVDDNKLVKYDIAVIKVPVGKYLCTIAFKGIIHKLIDVVDRQPSGNITLQSVIKAVNRAVDETDVLVDCECADWKYRFAYYATKYGYKYGKPERRPAKITNPDDKLGAMCKHLTSILANKQWMIKLSSIVNQMIKDNYDAIVKIYKLDPEEFFINTPGRPSASKNRNTKMLRDIPNNIVNKEKEPFSDIDNDNDEELELDKTSDTVTDVEDKEDGIPDET